MNRLARHYPLLLGGILLTAIYAWAYLHAAALPGRSAQFPEGWWGWFDQGRTLESARALATGDLAPAHHWYPLGYAVLGVPFVLLGGGAHPFVLVDAACLLLAFLGFVAFAERCGLHRWSAAALFLACVAWDRQSFGEWAIPWNSSAAAALLWLLLAQCAAWMDGVRRPWLLGTLAAAAPLCRPTEAPAVAICLLWLLAADWRAFRLPSILRIAAGGLLVALPYAALHAAIYGWAPSEYMIHSRALGFTLHDFGWKAFVILADPYPWFMDGPGLLRRMPWMALGLAGILPALLARGPRGLLAAALAVHLVLYVSYLDLLPTGIWRYNNIHYWKWVAPAYGLLAWLLLRDLAHWRRNRPWPAAAGLACAALLALLRVAPQPTQGPAKMLEFHGDAPGFDPSYFGDLIIQDAHGAMANITDMRAIPVPGGMRVIALTREFDGPVTLRPARGLAPALVADTPARFAERLVLGRPCWLLPCGRRDVDPLLPPVD